MLLDGNFAQQVRNDAGAFFFAKSCRWLVGESNARAVGEGTGDGHALSFPAPA